jgi:hypothetical protein
MLEIDSNLFDFLGSTNSFANLSAAFPGGDYTFSISNETITLNVPAGAALPNPPQLSGFAGAQTINAASAFTPGLGEVDASAGVSASFPSGGE